MQKILFEDTYRNQLLPLTYTRPVFELRAGVFTIKERWEAFLGEKVFTHAHTYLAELFSDLPQSEAPQVWINGRYMPDEEFLREIEALSPDTYLATPEGHPLAACFSPVRLAADFSGLFDQAIMEDMGLKEVKSSASYFSLARIPDMFLHNERLIGIDVELIRKSRKSQKIKDRYTRIYGEDNLFIEEGVQVKAAILNAEDGPIYLGKGANIQEGAIIRRSHAICEYAQISMGAKLRGDSTVGPYSKVGGEMGNSVIMGYSSKAHEGYLGNSVLGYWCNLGADTNCSNLKNNYANVRIWDYQSERFADTGLQFCGLIMGDHSKTAINTMFNTGTVVGVFANIFGSGFPRNFIPSFSWGGAHGFSTYQTRKAFEVAEKVMKRRNHEFAELDRAILSEIFQLSAPYRRWEMEKV
ncbi:MAG: GlmU family protein [Bacteroidota bacterium]